MASHLGPPPTINTLERNQRLRLIRSNRKLEAVLGSVPYYPEPAYSDVVIHESDLKASRRGGRIFGHSPSPTLSASSSTTSLASMEDYVLLNKSFDNYTAPHVKQQSAKPKGSTHVSQVSRPGFLRLRSTHSRPSDRRVVLQSHHLPAVAPSPPTSPTFTIDLENLQSTGLEQRRKKMARVVRTLGENVPSELVFPPRSADNIEKPPKSRQTERKPIPASFASSAPASYSTQPHVMSKPKPLSRTNYGSSGTAQHTRSAPHTTSQPSPNGNPASKEELRVPTIAERRRKTRPRSLSLSTGTDVLVAAAKAFTANVPQPARGSSTRTQDHALTIDEKATRDILQIRSPLAFQTILPSTPSPSQHRHAHSSPSNINFDIDVRVGAQPIRASKGHTKSSSVANAHALSSYSQRGKRRERGWSGEWNQDLQQVVKTLRTMKAR